MKPNSEQIFTTKYVPFQLSPKGMKLCFVGDIHSEVGGHCRSAFDACIAEWREDLKHEAKGGPRLGVIFMGDEADSLSASERKALEHAELHGQTQTKLNKMIISEMKDFRKKVAFLDDHLVGMIQGNHHWLFKHAVPEEGIEGGMTSTEWLCQQLGTHWLGFLTYLRLGCSNTTCRFPFDIVACHGKAGAKLVGTSLNQIVDLKMVFPTADAYAMGHDHQLGAWKTNTLEIPKGSAAFEGRDSKSRNLQNMAHLRVSHQEQAFLRTGSCLRGYDPGQPSYTVGGLFRPTALGMARLTAQIKRHLHTSDNGTEWRESAWDLTATI